MPLIVREPMGAAQIASWEAEMCKRNAHKHLLYYHIFGMGTDNCIGQTWYLCVDMIFFILSPLIVYPLWLSKKGKTQKIFAISWWALLLLTSMFASLAFSFDSAYFENFANTHSLPPWNFSPWGYRNQCYLIGLMMGYILHMTKNMEIKIDFTLNIIIWQIIFLVAYGLVYGPYVMDDIDGSDDKAYYFFFKNAWGVCLAWVTFACVKGIYFVNMGNNII